MKRTAVLTSLSASLLLATVLVTGLANQGCSSDESSTTSATTKRPPTKPSGPATSDSSTKTFAVNKLFLGDAPRNGGPASSTAWKKFGYDLDGKITSSSSTDVCKLPPNSDRSYKEDGDQGIDNSFGHNLTSLITGLSKTAATDLQNQINDGTFSLLFTVSGLSDDTKQTATGLKGYLNAAATFDPSGQKKPAFTPTEEWSVRPELLTNPSDPTSSKVRFDDAYVASGTFVSAGSSSFTLTLSFSNQKLDLTIYKPIVTFDHASTTAAANGVIAGIIKTEELLSGLTSIASRLDKKFCNPNELVTITDSIRAVSDIMADGTQDPNKTCDGISIGLGFEATQVANPTKVAAAEQGGGDLCSGTPDGGTDSGSDSSTNTDSSTGNDAGTDAPADSAAD